MSTEVRLRTPEPWHRARPTCRRPAVAGGRETSGCLGPAVEGVTTYDMVGNLAWSRAVGGQSSRVQGCTGPCACLELQGRYISVWQTEKQWGSISLWCVSLHKASSLHCRHGQIQTDNIRSVWIHLFIGPTCCLIQFLDIIITDSIPDSIRFTKNKCKM